MAPDPHRSVPVLGVATSHVTDRARALLAPAPRGAGLTLWVMTLLIATAAAAVASTLQIHHGFELAEMTWWTATGWK